MAEHKEEELVRWRGLVSEQVASGKSVAAFCRDRGLRDWQLYEWKKRLRAAESVPFVAVKVASDAVVSEAPTRTAASATGKRSSRLSSSLPVDSATKVIGVARCSEPLPALSIEIRHRCGWSLVVEPGFDASHLRRLLDVLERES
jgi:hypothetical protein